MAEEKPKEEDIFSPEPPDKESKEIMEGIEKEKEEKEAGAQPEEKGAEKPEKKEEKAGKEGKEEEEIEEEEIKEEEEEEGEEKEPKRTPRLIPLWKHRVLEKKMEKLTEEKEREISDLKRELAGTKEPAERQKTIETFAEQFGLDPEMVKGLLKLIPVPTISEDTRKELDAIKEEKEMARQERLFGDEYEKKIEPLLKEDGVSEDKRPKLRVLLRSFAFTTKYAGNDLDEIYFILKHNGTLDPFLVKGRKSAEASRGGARAGGGGEEFPDVLGMSDEEFEKWSNEQAAKESKFTIKRAG